MADNVVDVITIEIVGDSTEAIGSLENVVNTLERLKTATTGINTRLSSFKTNLESIRSATSGIDSSGMNTIQELAQSLAGFNGVSISATIPKRLEALKTSIDSLNTVDIERLNEIVNTLSLLNGVDLSGFSAAAASFGAAQAEVSSAAATVDMPDMAGAQGEIEATTGSLDNLQSKLNETEGAASRFSSMFKSAMGGAQRSANGLFSSISNGFRMLKTMLIRRVLYRLINSIISGITKAVKEGINAVYEFSKQTNRAFATTMDMLATDAKWVKGSLGAAFAELVENVAPMIDRLAEKFVNFLNILNQVFARLNGKDTWLKATKVQQEYTGATNKATAANKKFKASILGIDELNVLQDNSDNSAASAAASALEGYNFEETPIDTEYIDGLINKFKSIWKWVKRIGAAFAAWKIGTTVLSFFSMFSAGTARYAASAGGIKGTLTAIANVTLILTAMMGLIALLGEISKIPGVKEALANGVDILKKVFGGLGEVMVPMVVFVGGVSLLGKVRVRDALRGITNFGLILEGILGVTTIIGTFLADPTIKLLVTDAIDAIAVVFDRLKNIAIPMVALSAYVVLLGKVDIKQTATGLANMALILDGTTAVITSLGAVMSVGFVSDFRSTGMDALVSLFELLKEIALPMIGLSAIVVALGEIGPEAVAYGIAGLGIIIDGMELLIVQLGALNQIPGFSWIVGEGGKALNQLADVISDFSGHLIRGITDAVMSALPGIGTKLSEFMTNLKPFLDGISTIDPGVAIAASAIGKVILTLTASSILDGLFGWVAGEDSINSFGQMLPGFAQNLVDFSNIAKDIDQTSVTIASSCAQMIVAFAQEIPNSGGMITWFAGDNDIKTFAEKLPYVGAALSAFSKQAKGVNKDVVVTAAYCGEAIAKFANTIGKTGGFFSLFTGNNDLKEFALKLPYAGAGIKGFSDKANGVKKDVVEVAAACGTAIAKFAKAIPNSGGLIAKVTGDNDIKIFTDKLPDAGTNLKAFSDNVAGIKASIVTTASIAGTAITTFAKTIPPTGGLLSHITGDNDIEAFGSKLPGFGSNFKQYYESVKNIKSDVVKKSSDAAISIATFAAIVPETGGISSWFSGDNDLGDFGEQLAEFGAYFWKYYGYIFQIKTTQVETVTKALTNLIKSAITVKQYGVSDELKKFGSALVTAGSSFKSFFLNSFSTNDAWNLGKNLGEEIAEGISYSLKYYDYPTIKATTSTSGKVTTATVSAYATGGFPTMGELFVAREAGPELVGSVNGRTAVVNNEQIVDSVAQGVAEANMEQNQLLKEQNEILRAILASSGEGGVISIESVVDALSRKNRRDGKTVVPIGT